MEMKVKIGSRFIGPQHPPFIVAELSGNHNGSLKRALQLVELAKSVGAHAVKIQTYTADTITLDIREGDFLIKDPKNLWKGMNLYELYQKASTPWEWHAPIFERCKKLNLIGFSSPFDETAVDFLEELEVPCYKIASPEIVDLPLVEKVASTGKPLIISTGASTLMEIQEAMAAARKAGCKDIILLKCTCAYPAQPKDANLRTIPDMHKVFGVPVGISDHTIGIGVSLAAVALGACVIEKHMTLSRADGGPDDAFSTEPEEMKALVVESEKAWESLGTVCYTPLEAEKVTLSHRPSLFFVQDLPSGTKVEAQHIRSLRPRSGLPPKEIEKVIGRDLKQDVRKGTPVCWDLFEE